MLKPRILRDINPLGSSTFCAADQRLNLTHTRKFRFNASPFLKAAVVGCVVLLMVINSVSAPTYYETTLAASSGDVSLENGERETLEAELLKLEGQIDDYEDQISGYQKQGKTLKNEIKRLNTKVAELNLQIKAINLKLAEINKQIDHTQSLIVTTEDTITSNKNAIGSLIRDLSQSEQSELIEIFLKKPRLSDFFNDLNGLSLLRKNLQQALVEVTYLHGRLVDQKTQLSLARADKESMKDTQDIIRKQTEQIKQEKNGLLEVTKGQESKYQALLKETKETASQIRSRIFRVYGGGEMSFKDAYELAKIAFGATGVRPALLLAVLDRESALGKNLGQCHYEKSMNPREQPIFLGIVSALGDKAPPRSIWEKVSCANADGAYGGAMGPAQFIPSTWKLYEREIGEVTGNPPPSPWRNGDAFVATALYLKSAGANEGTVTAERRASARYYAGSRWSRYLWTYGQAVIDRAARFQEDIKTITS